MKYSAQGLMTIIAVTMIFSLNGFTAEPLLPKVKENIARPTLQLFFIDVKSLGGKLLCNPNEIERRLKVHIAHGEVINFGPGDFKLDAVIEPNDLTSPIIAGTYHRSKNVNSSTCEVRIKVQPDALCNFRSDDYIQTVGYAIENSGPHYVGPPYHFLYYFSSTNEQIIPEIWVTANSGEDCAISTIMRVTGNWLVDD